MSYEYDIHSQINFYGDTGAELSDETRGVGAARGLLFLVSEGLNATASMSFDELSKAADADPLIEQS